LKQVSSEKYIVNIGHAEGTIIGDNATVIMTFFSIAASISSITQVILMIADMRSKRNKNKQHSIDETILDKLVDKIKLIRVQMSDNSWVQMDSWLNDPERVKEFLNIYH
jgi:hypothetical protein